MIRVSEVDNVQRLDLAATLAGRGRYWTTAYLAGEVLIDSGCAHTAQELLSHLQGRRITHIINTHSHEDHIGANGLLQKERSGLTVLAHPRALPVLANPRRNQPLHPYRKVMWGWPRPCSAESLNEGDKVEVGELSFRVLYTPGHSSDHICLYEEKNGWLFSGDLYVGGRDRALRAGCDIWAIIAALERVADLDISILFPGSARIPDSPREALQGKIQHLTELGQRILKLNRQGWSERRIMQSELGKTMFIEWITLGHFSRRRLLRSYLERNGRLEPLAPVEGP